MYNKCMISTAIELVPADDSPIASLDPWRNLKRILVCFWSFEVLRKVGFIQELGFRVAHFLNTLFHKSTKDQKVIETSQKLHH